MTERTTALPEASEQLAGEPATPAPTKRPPGRPRGTDYRRADAPLHAQMRRLLEDGIAHSRTAAARLVARDAHGHGCEDSKVRRLVRRFPY